MAKDVIEIRWHGRGGQGAKTAATAVAEAAIDEGKFSQGFHEYGPERLGAPIKGYTRISEEPITDHSAIYFPDYVVVLDETLLEVVDVCENLSEEGAVIINTTVTPDEIKKKLGAVKGTVYTVDATQISIDEIGRPIPNTPMIGALMKVTGAVGLEAIYHDIEKKFGAKFGTKIVEGNKSAIKRAFEEVKS